MIFFTEYNEAVNMSLYSRDPQCVEDIQAAVAEMDTLLSTSDGVTRLNEIFKWEANTILKYMITIFSV